MQKLLWFVSSREFAVMWDAIGNRILVFHHSLSMGFVRSFIANISKSVNVANMKVRTGSLLLSWK